jgi:hypothetical protein
VRANELLALVMRRPFQPFRLYLSNGQSHEVRHPEIIRVERSVAWLPYPEQTLPGLPERRIFVNLIHIVWGEVISTQKPAGDGAAS